MGYRLGVAVMAAFFLVGCSAFDSDNTPYEGMKPGDPVPGINVGGIYSGYYAGDMTVDANSCASVSDEQGSAIDMGFEVIHADTTVNIIFDDGTTVAGTLDGEKVTIMVENLGVKHVYYFTFADGEVTGSAEVIEADAAGEYSSPCATYSVALKKGEKPQGSAEEKEGPAKAL